MCDRLCALHMSLGLVASHFVKAHILFLLILFSSAVKLLTALGTDGKASKLISGYIDIRCFNVFSEKKYNCSFQKQN